MDPVPARDWGPGWPVTAADTACWLSPTLAPGPCGRGLGPVLRGPHGPARRAWPSASWPVDTKPRWRLCQQRGRHSLPRDAMCAPPLGIPEPALRPFPGLQTDAVLTMVVLVPQIKAESAAGRPAHQPWCCTQRGRARRGMERTRLVAARRKTPGWGPWGPAHPSPHFPPDAQQRHLAVPSVVPGRCQLDRCRNQQKEGASGSQAGAAWPSRLCPVQSSLAGSARRGLGGDPGFSHVLPPVSEGECTQAAGLCSWTPLG